MALPESLVSDGKLTTPAIVALALLAFIPVALIGYCLWARCRNGNGGEGADVDAKGDEGHMMETGSTANLVQNGGMPGQQQYQQGYQQQYNQQGKRGRGWGGGGYGGQQQQQQAQWPGQQVV